MVCEDEVDPETKIFAPHFHVQQEQCSICKGGGWQDLATNWMKMIPVVVAENFGRLGWEAHLLTLPQSLYACGAFTLAPNNAETKTLNYICKRC